MNFVFIVYHLVLSRKMGEKIQRGNARKVLLMVFRMEARWCQFFHHYGIWINRYDSLIFSLSNPHAES